jgi:four helix bundle protein
MSRDPQNQEAFVMADALVVAVYEVTRSLPMEERFGLQSQLRRAAISVVANLVEGSARRSQREYLHFVGIAVGSASETRYLLNLAERLGYVLNTSDLRERYRRVIRAMQSLTTNLSSKPPRPEARGPRP